jgi:hypothetical protein
MMKAPRHILHVALHQTLISKVQYRIRNIIAYEMLEVSGKMGKSPSRYCTAASTSTLAFGTSFSEGQDEPYAQTTSGTGGRASTPGLPSIATPMSSDKYETHLLHRDPARQSRRQILQGSQAIYSRRVCKGTSNYEAASNTLSLACCSD